MSISASFYQRLTTDAELAKMISDYNGLPAVFTASPVPANASLPYIVTAGNVSDTTDVPANTKNRTATQFMRDIRIFADQTGSMAKIEQMGERVWSLFHKKPLSIPGWTVLEVKAARPVIYPQDDVYGIYVTVVVTMQQN